MDFLPFAFLLSGICVIALLVASVAIAACVWLAFRLTAAEGKLSTLRRDLDAVDEAVSTHLEMIYGNQSAADGKEQPTP